MNDIAAAAIEGWGHTLDAWRDSLHGVVAQLDTLTGPAAAAAADQARTHLNLLRQHATRHHELLVALTGTDRTEVDR